MRQEEILHCVCPPVNKAGLSNWKLMRKVFFSNDSLLYCRVCHCTEIRKQSKWIHIAWVVLYSESNITLKMKLGFTKAECVL